MQTEEFLRTGTIQIVIENCRLVQRSFPLCKSTRSLIVSLVHEAKKCSARTRKRKGTQRNLQDFRSSRNAVPERIQIAAASFCVRGLTLRDDTFLRRRHQGPRACRIVRDFHSGRGIGIGRSTASPLYSNERNELGWNREFLPGCLFAAFVNRLTIVPRIASLGCKRVNAFCAVQSEQCLFR